MICNQYLWIFGSAINSLLSKDHKFSCVLEGIYEIVTFLQTWQASILHYYHYRSTDPYFFGLDRICKLKTPPPLGPNLGKYWNADYFEIFVPPLTFEKKVMKPFDRCKNSAKILSNCYMVTISIIYQSCMYQILPRSYLPITHILSKSRPYYTH